jgi:hypothetical protein
MTLVVETLMSRRADKNEREERLAQTEETNDPIAEFIRNPN